jgi:hypothetical protein
MARNADEGELARISPEVSVQRLAEARAIALAAGTDGDLAGVCPLCEADEGLAVSPSSNVWACSACGEGGGPVEWLMPSRACRRRTRSSYCARGCRRSRRARGASRRR